MAKMHPIIVYLIDIEDKFFSGILCANTQGTNLTNGRFCSINKPLGVLTMLKKTMSNFRLAALGVAVAGSMMTTQAAAEVEVAASAAVSSMYFWRGQDLGNGSPAVSGDIVASSAGAYGGIWGSSGDSAAGTEYDLFLGYGGEVDGFSYDVSVWNYVYPSATDGANDSFGDLSEIIVSLGFGPVTFTYYDNVAGGTGYEYYTLSGGYEDFSANIGYSDPEGSDNNYTHLDLGYAYNENLSFTLSKVIDVEGPSENEGGMNEDTLFVVSYSLPIDIK